MFKERSSARQAPSHSRMYTFDHIVNVFKFCETIPICIKWAKIRYRVPTEKNISSLLREREKLYVYVCVCTYVRLYVCVYTYQTGHVFGYWYSISNFISD